MVEREFALHMDDTTEKTKSSGPIPQEGTVPLAPLRKKGLTRTQSLFARLALTGALVVSGNEAIKAVGHLLSPEKPKTEQTVHASEPEAPASSPQAVNRNSVFFPMLFHGVGSAAIKRPIPIEPPIPTDEPGTPTKTATPPIIPSPTHVPPTSVPPTPTPEIGGQKKEILIPSEAYLNLDFSHIHPLWKKASEVIPADTMSPVKGTVTGPDGSKSHLVTLPDGKDMYCPDTTCKIAPEQQKSIEMSAYGAAEQLVPADSALSVYSSGSDVQGITIPFSRFGGNNSQNHLIEQIITPQLMPGGEGTFLLGGNERHHVRFVFAPGQTRIEYVDYSGGEGVVRGRATANMLISGRVQIQFIREGSSDRIALLPIDEAGVATQPKTLEGEPFQLVVPKIPDTIWGMAMNVHNGGLDVSDVSLAGSNISPARLVLTPEGRIHGGVPDTRGFNLGGDMSLPLQFVSAEGHHAITWIAGNKIMGDNLNQLAPYTDPKAAEIMAQNAAAMYDIITAAGLSTEIHTAFNSSSMKPEQYPILGSYYENQLLASRNRNTMLSLFDGPNISVKEEVWQYYPDEHGIIPTSSTQAAINIVTTYAKQSGRPISLTSAPIKSGEVNAFIDQLGSLGSAGVYVKTICLDASQFSTSGELTAAKAKLKNRGYQVKPIYGYAGGPLTFNELVGSGLSDMDGLSLSLTTDLIRNPGYFFYLGNGRMGYNIQDDTSLDTLKGLPGTPLATLLTGLK